MNPNQINWLAVFAAALSTFLIGGLWYSPVLFGKVWMRVNGFSEEQVAGFNKARAFGGSFILALVMQPRPIAETSRPLFPSLRFFIGSRFVTAITPI